MNIRLTARNLGLIGLHNTKHIILITARFRRSLELIGLRVLLPWTTSTLTLGLASRSRMTHYLATTTIRNDPAWNRGDYMTRTLPARTPTTSSTTSTQTATTTPSRTRHHPRPYVGSTQPTTSSNPPKLVEQIINPHVLPKMPTTKYILVPISDTTRRSTHTQAAVCKDYLIDFLARTAH